MALSLLTLYVLPGALVEDSSADDWLVDVLVGNGWPTTLWGVSPACGMRLRVRGSAWISVRICGS